MLFSAEAPVATRRGAPELESRLRRRTEIERAKGVACFSENDPALLRCAERLQPLLSAGLDLLNLYRFGLRNAMSPVVRRKALLLPNLPASFHGFRLLHLSDLHIDGIDGLDEIVADVVSTLKVDLCVLTGDYRFATFGDCSAVYDRMRHIIEHVDAIHGAVGILGNHDAAAMAFGLEEIGIRILVNESLEVRRQEDSIWIAGVDDPYEYHTADLPLALEDIPAGAFRIVLAHTPQLVREAAHRGIDLYLCGHTHGGQIRLPWIGPVIDNGASGRRYNYGLWRRGRMQGYTSAGVGCSMLPVRFNCPPEIGLFELRSADAGPGRAAAQPGCEQHDVLSPPVQTVPIADSDF